MPAKSKAVLEEENDALRFELAGAADALKTVTELNRKLQIFADQLKEQRDILFRAIKKHRDTLQHPTSVDSRMYRAVVEVAEQIAKRRERCERICSPVDGKCRGDCVLDDANGGEAPRESDECWPHG